MGPRNQGWVVRAAIVFLLLLSGPGPAGASPLGAAAERLVRQATFEVVARRPDRDSLAYERPLPLDLIPYAERQSPFVPIGTAFAVGRNEFVTAAHVFTPSFQSSFGAPLLRAPDGSVHELGAVTKYSAHEDFVVFTLKAPPKLRPLAVLRRVAMNTEVHAVGNALGGGVVLRDGLLTSMTPEDDSGRWSWLRFSAAASPGNSGGPLLDSAGRVVGVVVAASPNENLNFALPIERVLDAPAGSGRIDQRLTYRFPLAPWTRVERLEAAFDLPLDIGALGSIVVGHFDAHQQKMRAQLLAEHAEQIFPRGQISERLLHTRVTDWRDPRIFQAPQGDSWSAEEPKWEDATELPADGYVQGGAGPGVALVRIRNPDDELPSVLSRDPARLGAHVAKALRLKRFVGSEQIAITSLGPPAAVAGYDDRWGRRWRRYEWPLEFADLVVVVAALAIPDGSVALARIGNTRDRRFNADDLTMLADFVYTPYTGRFAQWRDFLAQSEEAPPVLRAAVLQLEPGKPFAMRTAQFEFQLSLMLQDTNNRSKLAVALVPVPAAEGPVLGIASMSVIENDSWPIWVNVMRVARPPQRLGGELVEQWNELVRGKGHWDGRSRRVDGVHSFSLTFPTRSRSGSAADGSPAAVYAITYNSGASEFRDADLRYARDWILQGFRVLE